MADTRPGKVNLGRGHLLRRSRPHSCVARGASSGGKRLARESWPRGYLPIDGLPAYTQATQKLVFGPDSPLLAAGRVATSQTVGGSGALRVGADLLKKALPKANVAISSPSWENHRVVFTAAGFDVVEYAYYDAATHGLDFPGMLADLGQAGTRQPSCCCMPAAITLRAWISRSNSGSRWLRW